MVFLRSDLNSWTVAVFFNVGSEDVGGVGLLCGSDVPLEP